MTGRPFISAHMIARVNGGQFWAMPQAAPAGREPSRNLRSVSALRATIGIAPARTIGFDPPLDWSRILAWFAVALSVGTVAYFIAQIAIRGWVS